MSNEITEQLQHIRLDEHINDDYDEKTIKLLDKIAESDSSVLQQLQNVNEDFLRLLQNAQLTVDVKTKVAKCIAEITKTDRQRKCFTEETIIHTLITAMQLEATAASIKNNANLEYLVQICRALGNIFYQNDDAREILMRTKGDEEIIKLLDVDGGGGGHEQQMTQFFHVRCGLISNFLVGGEAMAKRAMELNIMERIERIIRDANGNEEMLLNVLPPLSILTENVPDLNFEPTLNRLLVQILAESKNPDIAEMCLDLLHYQAENGKNVFCVCVCEIN